MGIVWVMFVLLNLFPMSKRAVYGKPVQNPFSARHHADEIWWNRGVVFRQVADLSDLLLPHVRGHRAFWCSSRPRLPTCLIKLHR